MKRPPFTRLVFVCASCHHWQVDMPPRALRELGPEALARAVAEAAMDEHDCPGEGGRVKVLGRWVDPPLMESGRPATGTLIGELLPAWWVWR